MENCKLEMVSSTFLAEADVTKQKKTNRMGKLILYGIDASPPVRACFLTLKALQLPFEYKLVNLLTGEHLSKEYLAKNPQHTVPTLEDDGKFIWDSHAIIAYLVSKYGKDDQLYPNDHYQRAVIDQRLHYDSGVIFPTLRNITAPLLFKNVTEVPQEKIDAIIAVYDLLEKFLKEHTYIAGDELTIADLSLISTITSMSFIQNIDAEKYVKLSGWVKRLEALPYYAEANGKGLQLFKDLLATKPFTIVQ